MKNLITSIYIRNEVNRLKDGKAPVYFQIKCNNTRTNFPAGNVYVDAERWNHTNKFSEKKRDSEELEIRIFLDGIIKEMNRIEDKFIDTGISYTAEMIKNRLLERDMESLAKNKTLKQAFKLHKDYFMNLVGKKEMKLASYKKYRSVETHVELFIKEKYNQTEFPLENVDDKFQDGFHLYLAGALGKKNTAIKYIVLFRKVIRIAVIEGWLKQYPLKDYKMTRDKPTRYDVLTKQEIQTLIGKDFEDAKLNKVRDYFLFQTMTGLAYTDFINLKPEHVVKSGLDMLVMKEREKTKEVATVNLQSLALEILHRYSNHPESLKRGCCFPYISNKEYNLFIKVAVKLCGITKNVTTHLARHTFGCLMVLNKVDPKAQQMAFGHSNSRQSELYARMFGTQAVEEQKKMDGIFVNPSETHLKKAS